MNKYLASVLFLALAVTSACTSKGDDDDSTGPNTTTNGGAGTNGMTNGGTGGSSTGGGSGGSGSSSGGGEDAMCHNEGEANATCSPKVPPFTGACAPAGECCHRSSNKAALDKLGPDDDGVIEYRLNYVDITNHPLTVGTPDLVRTAKQRADVCAGEQCLLWRFTAPRKGGQFVAGPGKVEIGIGAYNCDGTYSFYGPNAAPDRSSEIGESDPGRWQSVEVPADFDPAKTDVERFHIPWSTNRNREVARSIFLWPQDFTLDWELASSGFTITEFHWDDAAFDCVGKRDGTANWSTVNGFVSYSPIKGNDKDISNQTAETYCALLAFGILPDSMKDTACTIDRCMPGTDGCIWKKLPDSLCPEDDSERAIFGCHLGDPANLNAEMGYPATVNCTPDKPTEPLDTDKGATSEGQCCDPLAKSTTLPACNAYRTTGVFVAGAAEITDKPIDGLAKNCFAK
jgi:hypothetical protein